MLAEAQRGLGVDVEVDIQRVAELVSDDLRVNVVILHQRRVGSSHHLKIHPAKSDRFQLGCDGAARLVKEGQSVVLDSGTTTTLIARALLAFHGLTVITNAVNIAAELAGTDAQTILTGGNLRENSFSLVGPLAQESLRRLSAEILFLGVDGFDIHSGLTTPNLLEASVNRVMIEIARRTVVMCDSSKFGRRSLSLIAPTSAAHQTITDRRISKSDLRALEEAGMEVTLA